MRKTCDLEASIRTVGVEIRCGTALAHTGKMERFAMAAILTKRRFTADEYQRMVSAGILREDDRVELIDGQVLVMHGIGPRHNACVAHATRVLLVARARGVYRSVEQLRRGQTLAPKLLPTCSTAVAVLLTE